MSNRIQIRSAPVSALPRSSQRHKSQGVILPLTLVLLVVLVTAGTVAARNAAVSEQVSNNFRTSNVAFQAAEIGIRYCESLAIGFVNDGAASFPSAHRNAVPADTVTIATVDSASSQWGTRSNWISSTSKVDVPAAFFKPSNTDVAAGATLTNAPVCMVERLPSSTNERFLITAWGRSNDSAIDANGRLTNGSETWLQSILKKPPAP